MSLSFTIQILMDSLLLFICCEGIFREYGKWKAKDLFLIPILNLGLCIARIDTHVDTNVISFQFMQNNYEIFPVNDIFMLFFFILVILVLNSVWYHSENQYTLFGTLGVFACYIIMREICILLFHICGVSGDIWYLYISRILSVLLALLILRSQSFDWIKSGMKDGNMTIHLIVGNTAVMLLVQIALLKFNIKVMMEYLYLNVGILISLILVDYILLFWEQKRIQERKRISMMEQYIPVIEELISQVRSRQHEYNNRLMAISSAVSTSENLEQAKEKVSELIQGVMIDQNDSVLLSCGSKLIGGMLYGKMKQAELHHISVQVDISAAFSQSIVQETDWIEIIGILMDNAIEASVPGDIIYFHTGIWHEQMEVLVSNPHAAFSNTEFMHMFRRGFTTKQTNSYANGHGLANIRQIVEHYGGKIITRNETIGQINYVTIGVLLQYN